MWLNPGIFRRGQEEKESEPKNKKSKVTESILDADEDDQIAAAIQASLKETTKKKEVVVENSDDSESDGDYDYFESFSAEASNSSLPTTSQKIEEKQTDTSQDICKCRL